MASFGKVTILQMRLSWNLVTGTLQPGQAQFNKKAATEIDPDRDRCRKGVPLWYSTVGEELLHMSGGGSWELEFNMAMLGTCMVIRICQAESVR